MRRSVLLVGASINFIIALLLRSKFGEGGAPVAASYCVSMTLLWIGLSIRKNQ